MSITSDGMHLLHTWHRLLQGCLLGVAAEHAKDANRVQVCLVDVLAFVSILLPEAALHFQHSAAQCLGVYCKDSSDCSLVGAATGVAEALCQKMSAIPIGRDPHPIVRWRG